ncbi:FAD-dependent oxidoreductase [Nocardia sp. NPDC005978]|uniref:FAD-dependent oxidoreductase n=1 Tax=Nocardia sp. NPDC005978 TaxID=3156725 RepID=UPI0033A995BC
MGGIVVIGGGIAGLATALFLARRGHPVTVLERESRSAGADLEADFLEWHRPGVPQAVQPHNLHAPVRALLRAEAPDVYATMLALGAEEWNDFEQLAAVPPQPGDSELVTLRARRIVVERALASAVRDQPEITMAQGDPATGLTLEYSGPVPRVTGVRRGSGELAADLVIDAAGRRSPVPRWLTAAGTRPAVIDSHPTRIAYFCRWHRLRPGAPRRPSSTATGGATPFALGGVFPSDNGVFATHLVVSTTDPTRAALRDPAVFESLSRTFPGSADWLALPHDPISPVLVMAGLDNRRTALVDEHGPIVTGLLLVGDSAIHTNPTLGLGIPFALRAAVWIATHAGHAADGTLTLDHHRWMTETLGPWFDHQVRGDKTTENNLALPPAPTESPRAEFSPLAALPWCALDDPHVLRARLRVRHLLDHPDSLLTNLDVAHRVALWLLDHPDFVPPSQGPSRARWEELTATATFGRQPNRR